MMRRERQAWLGVSIFLTLLAAVGAPTAFGATASWELDTSSYDFGSVLLGSGPTEPHEFVLTNTGETTLALGVLRLSMRVFGPLDSELFKVTSNGCHGKSLEPQESCSIAVSFSPGYPGPREGKLRISAKNGELPPVSVALEGDGIGPWVSIQPERLIFESAEVGRVSPAQGITVKNQGNLGLTIEGMSFTDLLGGPQSPSPFQIAGGSCHEGQVVVPDGSCTIEVALAPAEPGLFQSKLAISDDASDSPQSIEVQGAGTAPPPASHTGGLSESSKRLRKTLPLAVRITHRPARVTARRAATFWFSVAPAGVSAECELDRLGFGPCSAPSRYTQLSSGRHEFQVRAQDPSNSSLSAITRFHWRIRRHR